MLGLFEIKDSVIHSFLWFLLNEHHKGCFINIIIDVKQKCQPIQPDTGKTLFFEVSKNKGSLFVILRDLEMIDYSIFFLHYF